MSAAQVVRRAVSVGAIAFAVNACMGTSDRGLSPARGSAGGGAAARGVIAAGTAVGARGEWSTQGHDYALSRYSDLTQITTATAQGLKLAWSFSTGELRGHEGAPLVVGNTMNLVTPFPTVSY